MDLNNQPASKLGVSERQTKGWTGMLFKLARDKLSGDGFAQTADNVSGLDDMITARMGSWRGFQRPDVRNRQRIQAPSDQVVLA